ncbi:hypothetical protein A6V39_02630 [Candidatus Mycoplasma haematobovis]|uniref:Ribonuclease 3 n=1 Tax=Candidatus Mycoplasma haematobovis TaxID=432608 RepID=A0A1A9QE84_9MOLU|nr:ribonuclease III domain-containing protein [Candidatus Mycoplasma haematobovis]OAL10311.1 hypothetical protein A6V39_02630 [Candidatus Mycoplasma haematobovis]
MEFATRLSDFLNSFFKFKINRWDLFVTAFTHSSFKGNKNASKVDYERLEFLGDSVIGFVITNELFKFKEDLKTISVLKKQIIRGSSLTYSAKKINLHKYIRVGKCCNCISDSMIEDVYEAFIGAVYYEFGIDKAKEIILNTLWRDFLNNELVFSIDHKTKLQELVYKKHKLTTSYSLQNSIINNRGHTVFKVAVAWGSETKATGNGTKLQEAEQDAARNAIFKHFN